MSDPLFSSNAVEGIFGNEAGAPIESMPDEIMTSNGKSIREHGCLDDLVEHVFGLWSAKHIVVVMLRSDPGMSPNGDDDGSRSFYLYSRFDHPAALEGDRACLVTVLLPSKQFHVEDDGKSSARLLLTTLCTLVQSRIDKDGGGGDDGGDGDDDEDDVMMMLKMMSPRRKQKERKESLKDPTDE